MAEKGQKETVQGGRVELLSKYYEMACHNLLCYSNSYAMEQAKEGFEEEWRQAKAECELLQEMIKEHIEEQVLVSEKETAQGGQDDYQTCQRLVQLEKEVAELKVELAKVKNLENVFVTREEWCSFLSRLAQNIEPIFEKFKEEVANEKYFLGTDDTSEQ